MPFVRRGALSRSRVAPRRRVGVVVVVVGGVVVVVVVVGSVGGAGVFRVL